MNSIITRIYDQIALYRESMNKRPPAIMITKEQLIELRACTDDSLNYHTNLADGTDDNKQVFGVPLIVEGMSSTYLDFRKQ